MKWRVEAEEAADPTAESSATLSWKTLREEEINRVRQRRKWLKDAGRWDSSGAPHVALALSGGGIRSATFSLGVLRALSRLKVMPKIDYLSTVSGGGYAGSFYCSLFVPKDLRGAMPAEVDETKVQQWAEKRAADLGDDVLGGNIGKSAVEQLRQGGHFLNPNGTSDSLFAAVVAFRNWLAVALVTGTVLLAAFLALSLLHTPDWMPLRNSAAWIETKLHKQSETDRTKGNETEKTAEAKASPPLPAVNCRADVRPGKEGVTATCAVAPAPEEPKKKNEKKIEVGPALGASPLWLAGAMLLPLWLGSAAWAYWLTRSGRIPASRLGRLMSGPAFVAASLSGVFAYLIAVDAGLTDLQKLLGKGVIVSALLGLLFYWLALTRVRWDDRESEGSPMGTNEAALLAEENRVRTKLSRWLTNGVFAFFGLCALALTDDAGRFVYLSAILPADYVTFSLTTGALGAIIPAARWLLKRVQSSSFLARPKLGGTLRRFGRGIALVVGILLFFALLSFWSALAWGIVWHGKPPAIEGPFKAWTLFGDPWAAPVLIMLFTVMCAVILGRGHSFLNQSSLSSFYAGRLRKAYLGASNVERIASRTAADLELASDDIELRAYYHPKLLAPVHLVNVTINETTSESSRVIQRDRKGKGMAVSPAGYTFVKDAPSADPVGFRLDQGEQLPLSSWMGISGAAFSTGMGQHTSLGLSLLAGLSNLRLGYWWNSPYPGRWRERSAEGRIGRAKQSVWDTFGDFVQAYLLREIRADYEGTHSNRWYLSDGGHFENMGVYELVRRRVPFIIASDNGADPNYEFADLVNLMRKIRIDFEAETELLSNDDLDQLLGADTAVRRAFGTLEDMVPEEGEERGQTGPYAALARIRYLKPGTAGEPAESTLLLIKPRIAGGELPDLIRYKKSDVSFPQQPTTDLFFDEAQWESYYRLGQLIAESVFAEDRPPLAEKPSKWSRGKQEPRPWRPVDLRPLPARA